MHHRFYLFTHIIILVTKFEHRNVFSEFRIYFSHQMSHFTFAAFKPRTIMIADYIRKSCLFHISLNADQMIEPFIPFGMLGRFMTWQHTDKLIGYTNGIYHFMSGIARMHVTPFEYDFGRRRIEILKFQLPYFTAVHRIGPFTTEFLHIEFMCTFTDFLIRIETDTNFTMFNFRVLFEISHCRNNFCDTGLIIGSQQRFSIGNYQIFPLVVKQFRKLCRTQYYPLFSIKHDLRTVIIFHDARCHILATHIRTRIHMGNKTDSGNFLIRIRRKGGEKITVFVQCNLFQA